VLHAECFAGDALGGRWGGERGGKEQKERAQTLLLNFNKFLELERYIDQARFIGIVASKAMLQAEWPTLERTIAVWSDPSGRKGRVVTLLLENVELPPSLRVRNWIDFRDPSKYEEGLAELVPLLTDTPRKRGRGGFSPTIPPTNP
jgi:TIR domain